MPVRNQEDAMKVSSQKAPAMLMEWLGLELGGGPVEELARFGARLMLTSYIHAEVEKHLGARPYKRSAQRTGCAELGLVGHRSGFDEVARCGHGQVPSRTTRY